MIFPLDELGGTGGIVHLATANGFPLATYAPIVAGLVHRARMVHLPLRAFWDGPPPSGPGSWETLADDFVAGLDEHGLRDVVAVGHSFGAVVSLIAAARAPERFRALALLDPTILIPPMLDRLREAKAAGWAEPNPLATRARKRRATFVSPADAFAYWRPKPLFADWSDAALGRYVAGMLRPAPSGEGYELTWSPAWEAYYYEAFYTGAWTDVERLDPGLPILAVGGELSDTFLPEARARFQALVPWAEMVTIPGRGHLFPQADPGATLAALVPWIDRVVS